jgi:hypothetical protein
MQQHPPAGSSNISNMQLQQGLCLCPHMVQVQQQAAAAESIESSRSSSRIGVSSWVQVCRERWECSLWLAAVASWQQWAAGL